MMNESNSDGQIISYEHGFDLVVDEKRTYVRYLTLLRSQFQSNKEIHSVLQCGLDREKKIQRIKTIVDLEPDDVEQYEAAIGTLIDELSSILKGEPSNYLVDQNTGQIIKVLQDGDIFTPPDYIGEDGELHKALPKVHPKVSLSLAASKISLFRGNELKQLVAKPEYQQTFAHLRDPQQILERATRLLESRGYQIQENQGEHITLTFGREQADTRVQSINPKFHRLNVYSSVIATKVMKLVSTDDAVWLTNFKFEQTAKYTFYTVDVYYKKIPLLVLEA